MYKYLLLVLLIPQLAAAQEAVQPVISTDYLSLLTSDSAHAGKKDTANAFKRYWQLKEPYTYNFPVKEIKIHNGQLSIIPGKKKYLTLGGNITTAVAVKTVNSLPALQDGYVQGRSMGGALAWQGPETGEGFSYGPSLNLLDFDGSAYPYDVNGRLVRAGTGDGKKAIAYNNNIFRNGYMLSHSFSLLGSIKYEYGRPDWLFSVKAFTTNETTVIQDNKNLDNNISISVERNIHQISIAGTYTYFISRFSNDNRAGFLNRVYQNSLLTPVSFDNSQGYLFANGSQRSYSNNADNPQFLLKNNGHSFVRTQQTGSFSVQKKFGFFTFAAVPSVDVVSQNGNESISPGTAFFPAGLPLLRQQDDKHYTLNAYAAYNTRYGYSRFSSIAKLNYVFNDERVNIAYQPAGTNYHYGRSTNDFSVAYNSTYEHNDISAGLNLGDKFYQSSTAKQHKFFLPEVSGFVRLIRLADYKLSIKLASTYNAFYSEPSIKSSYASYALTQLAPQDAFKFMPVTEVQSFNNLQPAQHNEFTSKIEISYTYRITLNAEVFVRQTWRDIFPVYENGSLLLKNMADQRLNGFELQLDFNSMPHTRKFSMSNSVSFYTYKSTVTHVYSGYEGTPIAGFNNAYKAVVEGRALGAIMGSSYARDASNKIIIGQDGFPLVNSQPTVIGNPVPDFTLKFSHNINWKNFSFNIDWEYKKGGDMWNGTQALLDYYGRSATTGAERNITGYVFNGVAQNGRENAVPVKFYDASLPVEQNRWVRYGYTGVAESYIQKADAIRVHNLSLAYTINFKKYLQKIKLLAYAENLIIWSAYKGADANQLLYDQSGSSGLDFFNLPSVKSYGINVSIQF